VYFLCILISSLQEKTSAFSLFFADLSARGHVLTYSTANQNKLKLKSFGEYNYDNIVMFAPTVEKLGSISFNDINKFSSDGGNVLIAVSRDVSDSVRDLTETFGVTIDKKGSEVIDHFETLAAFDNR
jgi:oligosaccharyltransferase complex subunit beta